MYVKCPFPVSKDNLCRQLEKVIKSAKSKVTKKPSQISILELIRLFLKFQALCFLKRKDNFSETKSYASLKHELHLYQIIGVYSKLWSSTDLLAPRCLEDSFCRWVSSQLPTIIAQSPMILNFMEKCLIFCLSTSTFSFVFLSIPNDIFHLFSLFFSFFSKTYNFSKITRFDNFDIFGRLELQGIFRNLTCYLVSYMDKSCKSSEQHPSSKVGPFLGTENQASSRR